MEESQQTPQNQVTTTNQLGSSMNLSLGGNSSQPSALSPSIVQPTTKTIRKEWLKFVQKNVVWNVWDGNRILQDYNGKHVFTTVYEADAFVPLARLVWLEDKLTQAANDEIAPKLDIEKLNQLKQVALQNIGELEGLGENLVIPDVAKPTKHSQYQVYWYQNDHLGTPRELTSNNGDIEWEAVYQAWGNTVTVEWQEVGLQSTELNAIEKSFLLQPHRFQGQIYDNETGLHYNRFRYYDPDAGRFISHDPIGLLGGDNQFQYAPNPILWIDPFGLNASPESASAWEYRFNNIAPGEKYNSAKGKLEKVATRNGWIKDSKMSKINKRDVYKTQDGQYRAADTQHGRFEYTDSRGKHLGEFDIDGNQTKEADKSGGHDLKCP